MLFELAGCLVLFFGISLGLAWPLVSRLPLDAAEKICATAAVSQLMVFLFAWTVYVGSMPATILWILPALSIVGLLTRRKAWTTTLGDPSGATLVCGQVILSLWSVAGLALVLSYSGGGWLADWFGHMQRTWFFLDHGPRDILFNGFDPLTSRPPLANIVNGAFLVVTEKTFSHYQLFGTLLGSLSFLPAGLLARRWGGARAIAALVLLFMVNPMYAQNVTYAWTKLPAAFFILTALYFFVRAQDVGTGAVHGILFATTLAAGLLTHYSAGPYALALGVAWFALGWHRRHEAAWWRITWISLMVGAMVLATWFGWTFANYGLHGSLFTNTSVTDAAPTLGAQCKTVAFNVRDTLVPHFLRPADFTLIQQSSAAGWWRDWFFQLYQVNFFFAFGCVTWAVILLQLWAKRYRCPPNRRWFWPLFILATAFLGIAAHGARDHWGLAHICLQPLVLLGLSFLASRWAGLGRPARLIVIAGATVDFALGILLQFGVQAYALERWFHPNRSIFEIVAEYSSATQMNFSAKVHNRWVFLGDDLVAYGFGLVVCLVACFLGTLLLQTHLNKPDSSRMDCP